MARFRCLIVLGTHVLALFLSAAAQQGFLNINCGATKNVTDSNMTWIDDSNYVNVGQPASVNNPAAASYLQSLRFFPKPLTKSCYRLPVKANVPYLLRLWFLFGNYNGIRTVPSFNVSVEAQGMLRMESFPGLETSNWTAEKILISSGNTTSVCLIRTLEESDPFISAIELRSLSSGMYGLQVNTGTMLNSVSRYDLGANSSLIRYPLDEFDRFWRSDNPLNLYNTSLVENRTSYKMVSSDNSSSNFPPKSVIQTAIIAKTQAIQLRLNLGEPKTKTLVALYFGEIETLNASEQRNFDVLVNGQSIATINFSTKSYTIEKRMTLNDTQGRELVLSLDSVKNRANSSRGPVINALEQYNILDTEPETLAEDVSSLLNFKSAFGINDSEWMSDPCFAIAWDGIRCEKGNPVRVLDINLSGKGLTGHMPQKCNLTRLEILRLQNNDLSGEIPSYLTTFPNLKELDLENNNFSGIIPPGLLNNTRLSLRIKGNPLLCQRYRSRCDPKGKNVGTVVGFSIGAILGAIILLMSIIIYRRRYSKKRNKANRSTEGSTTLLVTVPNTVRFRQFSLVEMQMATKNFTQKIGQGGFGSVYFGCLQDEKEVAVKELSTSSKQGVPEFLNEIGLLSRVNHTNLVSLLGYCNDSNRLMLVYEYMGEGSLKDHLYGSLAEASPLDWKSRLQIALDAAEGLEYLHVKSTPTIIHRDVKSDNILLDRSMRAKVADFGLSKILGDEVVTHVTTKIKGTFGYLDPEYAGTGMLTERSDVFSFGVVLLEIICGRKPVMEELPEEEEINIVKWVKLHAETTEDPSRRLTNIIDRNLSMSEDEMKSFYILHKLAIACTHKKASKRPTMSKIVAGIREAMSVIGPHKEPTEKPPVEPLCSNEMSSSLCHVGR